MTFDWSDFTAEDFAEYCARLENGLLYENDFIGCVRAGEVCFDLVLYIDATKPDEPMILGLDCYAGCIAGHDAAYAFSDVDEGYPYELIGGDGFDDACTWMSYEQFQKAAEEKMNRFIQENKTFCVKLDLPTLAEMPLHVW